MVDDKRHATRCTAQKLNNSNLCTPVNTVNTKIPKPNTPVRMMEGKDETKEVNMQEVQRTFTAMTKLENLDNIEADMKEIKYSLEFTHQEIADLRKENEANKAKHERDRARIDKLEEDNATLRTKIVHLRARSMHDNLLFFNIPEHEQENTTEIIHELLESKMGIDDTQSRIKIDRSHRIGKKRDRSRKPRLIVVKFNYHQDREHVRLNAKKFKGANIGVSEQFPEELESVRKMLYPEFKKQKVKGQEL